MFSISFTKHFEIHEKNHRNQLPVNHINYFYLCHHYINNIILLLNVYLSIYRSIAFSAMLSCGVLTNMVVIELY